MLQLKLETTPVANINIGYAVSNPSNADVISVKLGKIV